MSWQIVVILPSIKFNENMFRSSRFMPVCRQTEKHTDEYIMALIHTPQGSEYD